MISAINISVLKNAVYIQFCKDFASLVEANNPTELSIKPQYDAFFGKIIELETLFKKSNASVVTSEIEALDYRRDQAINGLMSIINAFTYHFQPPIASAALVLQNNLKLYGVGIARENYQSETAILNNIINDWENKTDLATALKSLNLGAWKDELKAANQLFNEKYLVRTQEYGAASPETLKAKREETNGVYYELRKFLDAFSVIQPTPVYNKTINELNALIEQYNALLVTRKSTKPENQ
jgi:hypothetical protein